MKRVWDAPITSIGVYTYTLPDGTRRRDLRKPEEVFKYESLETLRGAPLTLDHPKPEDVKNNNFEIVGAVLNAAQGWDTTNLTNIVGTLSIYKTIADLEQYFLSAGYECEVDETPGVWCGVEYDAVQKNIKYNHVALVTQARAGETTSLKEVHMDSANGQIATEVKPTTAPAAAPTPSVEVKADGADKTVVTTAPAPAAPASPEVQKEVKADGAQAPTVTAPAAPAAPEPAKTEVKADSVDFVTKAEFGELMGLVKGLGETISKLVPAAPVAPATEAHADSATAAPAPAEPARPVVELKMDGVSEAKDERSTFINNFFSQGGSK